MATKPDPKTDDRYSEKETARRRDATIKAMIGMPPRSHPKGKAQPESKGRSDPKGDSNST